MHAGRSGIRFAGRRRHSLPATHTPKPDFIMPTRSGVLAHHGVLACFSACASQFDLHFHARAKPVNDRHETIDSEASQVRVADAREVGRRNPVRLCAARTVNLSRSSALMISAARIALNCSTSAFSCLKSRKTFPLPRTPSICELAWLSAHSGVSLTTHEVVYPAILTLQRPVRHICGPGRSFS